MVSWLDLQCMIVTLSAHTHLLIAILQMHVCERVFKSRDPFSTIVCQSTDGLTEILNTVHNEPSRVCFVQ